MNVYEVQNPGSFHNYISCATRIFTKSGICSAHEYVYALIKEKSYLFNIEMFRSHLLTVNFI